MNEDREYIICTPSGHFLVFDKDCECPECLADPAITVAFWIEDDIEEAERFHCKQVARSKLSNFHVDEVNFEEIDFSEIMRHTKGYEFGEGEAILNNSFVSEEKIRYAILSLEDAERFHRGKVMSSFLLHHLA